MVKALQREQGSPRGRARFGFADDQPPQGKLSDADRSKAIEHIQQTRAGFGFLWGVRDDPTPNSQRSHLETTAVENRSRLGFLIDRDTMPAEQRVGLTTQKQEERNRLGMLDERITGSESERGRIHAERLEARGRLGMESHRHRWSEREVAAHFDGNQQARTKLGFASQFGDERRSTSEADLRGVVNTKVEERARLGMISARSSTDWEANRGDAKLRSWFFDKGDVERVRLYADEGRTFMRTPRREVVMDMTHEGRCRLGMLEGKGFADKVAPRSVLDRPKRAFAEDMAIVQRSRLGMVEGVGFQDKVAPRTVLDAPPKAQMLEKSTENYTRLGMIHNDGPQRLRTSTTIRDTPTAELRATAELAQSRGRSRMGFIEERTASTPAVRSRADQARRDARDRFNMLYTGSPFDGDRSQNLTPRAAPAAGCSMHFTNSVTPRLGTADARYDSHFRRMARSKGGSHASRSKPRAAPMVKV